LVLAYGIAVTFEIIEEIHVMKSLQKLCTVLIAIAAALPLLCMEETRTMSSGNGAQRIWDVKDLKKAWMGHILNVDPNDSTVEKVCKEPSVNKALEPVSFAITSTERINKKYGTTVPPVVYLGVGITPQEMVDVCKAIEAIRNFEKDPEYISKPSVTTTNIKNMERYLSANRGELGYPAHYNAEFTTPERCVRLIENTGLVKRVLKTFGICLVGSGALFLASAAQQGDGTNPLHTVGTAGAKSAVGFALAGGLGATVYTLCFDAKNQFYNSWPKTKQESRMFVHDAKRNVVFDRADE
jgi:hypothetical protein